jgi:hypothetical protein
LSQGGLGPQAAPSFLACAHDIEQRVVDPDRHPDQQHHGLDAVVERERLADRAEQAKAATTAVTASATGAGGHEGSEHEQQHEQRHRHRQSFGPAEVVARSQLGIAAEDRHDGAVRTRVGAHPRA